MQRERLIPCVKVGRAIVAVWLVAWMLFSSLLAASPALHEHFHENAAQSSHQCAVTLLEQQQLLSGESHVFVVVADFPEALSIPAVTFSFSSQADFKLLPGRAPPVLS